MTQTRDKDSVVRVLNAEGIAVGMGILLDSGEIFTVSHVLNIAAGDPLNKASSRVGERFDIDFPLIGQTPKMKAEVARWVSPANSAGDVATLRLLGDAPTAGVSLDPTLPDGGAEVTVLGFVEGDSEGSWAKAQLVETVASGRWQLNQDANSGPQIRSGFSGSPVWNAQGLVLGIIWGGKLGDRVSHMIPAEFLHRRRSTVTRKRYVAPGLCCA